MRHRAADESNSLSKSTLTSLTPNLKIGVVLSSVSDGAAVAATNAPTHSRWSRWARFMRRQSPRPDDNPDLRVATWKAAWLSGAKARWEAISSGANPYATGQERMAWAAGWRWAQQNPDRRNHREPRMAHRRRRAGDSTPHLTRTLGLSAVGLSVFFISRAVHRWAKGAPGQS